MVTTPRKKKDKEEKKKITKREEEAKQSLLPEEPKESKVPLKDVVPKADKPFVREAEQRFGATTPEKVRAVREGTQLIQARERALSQTGGNREAAAQLLEAQRQQGLTQTPVEEVRGRVEAFTESAQQAGLLEAPDPLTPEIAGLGTTISTNPTVEAVKSGFIKADKALGITGQSEIISEAVRRENLKDGIRQEVDTGLVELGMGRGIFKFLKSDIGKVAAGIIVSQVVSKPLSVLIDFDRKANTLNAAIPDLRERTTIVTSGVRSGTYTAEEGLARIDEIEDNIRAIEHSIRLSSRFSPTINTSGSALQIRARLDKAKEQLRRERANIFLLQQQQVFPEASEEELLNLLKRVQQTSRTTS